MQPRFESKVLRIASHKSTPTIASVAIVVVVIEVLGFTSAGISHGSAQISASPAQTELPKTTEHNPIISSSERPTSPSADPLNTPEVSVNVGSFPYWATYDDGNGYVYIPNENSDNVSVISGTTLVTSITVGLHPRPAAYDSANGYVYVPIYNLDSVVVISGTTVVTSISLQAPPTQAVYDGKNGYVYAVAYDQNVSVISGKALVGTIDAHQYESGSGGEVYAFVDTRNGDLYIPNYVSPGYDNVSVVSGMTFLGLVHVGGGSFFATYDSGNGYVYIENSGSANISVISGTTLLATIDVESCPLLGAYDSENGYVYVPNCGSSSVSVISGTTVVANVGVGSDPRSSVYDSGNGDVYVDDGQPGVSVINGTTLLGTLGAGDFPGFAAYDNKDGDIYVPNADSDNVTVLEPAPFELLITPSSRSEQIGLTGTAEFDAEVILTGGKPSVTYTISLSYASGQANAALNCSMDDFDPFYLVEPHTLPCSLSVSSNQPVPVWVLSSARTPITSLHLIVTAKPSKGTSEKADLTISISRVVGLQNKITFGGLSIVSSGACSFNTEGLDECLSVQQNFFVSTLTSSGAGDFNYWAQNMIEIGFTGTDATWVAPIFQVWTVAEDGTKSLKCDNARELTPWKEVSTVVGVNLDFNSYVSGGETHMSNKYHPSDYSCSIAGENPFINLSWSGGLTQFVAVGPTNGETTSFGDGTSGSIIAQVNRSSDPAWVDADLVSVPLCIFTAGETCPPTGFGQVTQEAGYNLTWTVTSADTASFKWERQGPADQGVAFQLLRVG